MTRRNKAWVTDITDIRTWQGWLYLAVVMDLCSRKIVGWSARPTIHRELVLDAVLVAVLRDAPVARRFIRIKVRSTAAMPGGASAAPTTWSRA